VTSQPVVGGVIVWVCGVWILLVGLSIVPVVIIVAIVCQKQNPNNSNNEENRIEDECADSYLDKQIDCEKDTCCRCCCYYSECERFIRERWVMLVISVGCRWSTSTQERREKPAAVP